jgi:hypothetical protein
VVTAGLENICAYLRLPDPYGATAALRLLTFWEYLPLPGADWLKAGLTAMMLTLVLITVLDAIARWVKILAGREARVSEAMPAAVPVEA